MTNLWENTPIVVTIFGLAGLVVGLIIGVNEPRKHRKGRKTGGSRKLRGGKAAKKDRAPRRTGGGVELYVGNLSYDCGEKEVGKLFERYGKVSSIRIITNRGNGRSKGYGFVQMANRDEATTAVRALNGKDVKGRRIVVNEAKSEAR
jgi:RNA recognition motif-containing protein